MSAILSENSNTSDGSWNTNADARDFTHVPLSGADGGYVEAFDRLSGDVRYFVGGAPFTGDLSLFAGGTLDYTIRQSSTSSQFDAVDVILVGIDRSIGFDFPLDQNPDTDWTDYSIDLTAAAGWFDLATGLAASNAEITAVLADLDSIEIRGEYRVGPDAAGLGDSALLGAGQVLEDFSGCCCVPGGKERMCRKH